MPGCSVTAWTCKPEQLRNQNMIFIYISSCKHQTIKTYFIATSSMMRTDNLRYVSTHIFVYIAGWSGTVSLPVSARDYMGSLRDQALLSVTVLAMVEETRQSWVSKVPYRLHRPDLTFVVDGKKGTKY